MEPAENLEDGERTLRVLLRSGDEELAGQCRKVSARIRTLSRQEVEDDPSLKTNVEIVYGHLPPAEWPEFPSLRWLQVTGAGVNGLLTPEVVESPVTITNVSGIHAAPITEHMFGFLLAYNRRLQGAWDQQRERRWDSGPLSHDIPTLEGKTLGLLGLGRIGERSARVGRAFGMEIIALRRKDQPHPDVERIYKLEQIAEFLQQSDVVMNTLPLTPGTRGLLGRQQMDAMKDGAVLVNTGRGGTVDTEALVEGLRRGRPGAALLDVTDPEPLPADHPLWSMPNVMITPHYAGAFRDYGQAAAAIFLDNLHRYLQGEPLTHVVDKAAGY